MLLFLYLLCVGVVVRASKYGTFENSNSVDFIVDISSEDIYRGFPEGSSTTVRSKMMRFATETNSSELLPRANNFMEDRSLPTCIACLEPTSNFIHVHDDHIYCVSCLQFKAQISQTLPVTCCNTIIGLETLGQVVSSSTLSRLLSHNTLRHNSYCHICDGLHSYLKPCDVFKIRTRHLFDFLSNRLVSICPLCKCIVSNDGGCDSVQCVLCGTYFCLVCSALRFDPVTSVRKHPSYCPLKAVVLTPSDYVRIRMPNALSLLNIQVRNTLTESMIQTFARPSAINVLSLMIFLVANSVVSFMWVLSVTTLMAFVVPAIIVTLISIFFNILALKRYMAMEQGLFNPVMVSYLLSFLSIFLSLFGSVIVGNSALVGFFPGVFQLVNHCFSSHVVPVYLSAIISWVSLGLIIILKFLNK